MNVFIKHNLSADYVTHIINSDQQISIICMGFSLLIFFTKSKKSKEHQHKIFILIILLLTVKTGKKTNN